MSSPCFYHPQIQTEKSCLQCGMPVCNQCSEDVAGRTACKSCVAVLTARINAELDRTPALAAAQSTPAPSYAGAAAMPTNRVGVEINPPSYAPEYSSAGNLLLASEESNTPAGIRLLLGIGAGLLVGLLGAVVWEKFVFYTGFNIGYITALLGFGVGYAFVWGSKQAGLVPALCSAAITLLVQVFGYYMLVNDYLARDLGGMHVPFAGVVHALPHLVSPLGGIIIAIGVWIGYTTPMRAAGHMQ